MTGPRVLTPEEGERWTPAQWAPHKPTDRPVKTWTSADRQTYVVACRTCGSPWPCEAEGWRIEAASLGRALTDMVDPLAIIRNGARSLDEDRQGDPTTIRIVRDAANRLNGQLVELRDRYPHPPSKGTR